MSQTIKIGINGFGRIGRKIVRLALSPANRGRNFQIVGINDLSSPEQIAHLFKYDSVHGTFPGDVKVENGFLIADGQKIRLRGRGRPSPDGGESGDRFGSDIRQTSVASSAL